MTMVGRCFWSDSLKQPGNGAMGWNFTGPNQGLTFPRCVCPGSPMPRGDAHGGYVHGGYVSMTKFHG